MWGSPTCCVRKNKTTCGSLSRVQVSLGMVKSTLLCGRIESTCSIKCSICFPWQQFWNLLERFNQLSPCYTLGLSRPWTASHSGTEWHKSLCSCPGNGSFHCPVYSTESQGICNNNNNASKKHIKLFKKSIRTKWMEHTGADEMSKTLPIWIGLCIWLM